MSMNHISTAYGRRVTVCPHPWKGYAVLRDGKDVVCSVPFYKLSEAVAFAHDYCSKWGDEYGGVVEPAAN